MCLPDHVVQYVEMHANVFFKPNILFNYITNLLAGRLVRD